jgi:aspartate/methionine/tyrosine aminotransferase
MAEWKDLTKPELELLLEDNLNEYEKLKALGLKLDLSRGKPSPDVLDLSNELLGALDTYKAEDGTDIRNYGVPTGLPEIKRLFSDLLNIPVERLVIGGNSSLNHMYNVFTILYLFGPIGFEPWTMADKVKILCPSPGYDRHFTLTDDFGAEMITVPMTEDGPDMDIVEKLVAEDAEIKGIWCVPLYSNPEGVVYSDETVKRLASMKTAAPDFRIFWDNAYGVHHIFKEHKIADIFKLAEAAGNPERAYYFFSTSKMSFPGGGIGMVAAGPESVKQLEAHIGKQTIGYDKIAQLKAVKFFKNPENIRAHMAKIADLLRPKFELVLKSLEDEFAGTGLVRWVEPKGGYFVSINVPDGTAKAVVALAKEAGEVLTGAGATYPHKNDPADSNLRIAPTYPSIDELEKTMKLLAVSIKIVALKQLLKK